MERAAPSLADYSYNQKQIVPQSTSMYLKVPQSTLKYLKVPQSTLKYLKVPQSIQK